ncbi:MAG: hypothetical protein ACE5E7_08830 [Anaerolineae bacterium]
MQTFYMAFWSITMIIAIGVWRLRSWGQMLVVTLVTALVLILSQSLFIQLSVSAGIDPGSVLSSSEAFLRGGPVGWLALLVMPCGWLGPIIGFNLTRRLSSVREELA